MDRDIAEELDIMRGTEGVEPTCRKGCVHCCRQSIPSTRLEAHVIAQHVKRRFSRADRAALRDRLHSWLTWAREELPELVNTGVNEHDAVLEHGPPCPLLEGVQCSVYPVRPAICRAHYVSSDPRCCAPRSDSEALDERPAVMESVHLRTSPHMTEIRKYLERYGLEFDESVSLLIRWLVIELGWAELLNERAMPKD